MPSTFSDYSTSASAQSTGGSLAPEGKVEYWSLDRCRKAYTNYLDNKQEEISEQKNARRYYHGSQHTAEVIKALNKRKQPVVTFNRIARKLNGVVGLIERLKQDPKAYPRTPQNADGAELATSAVRYALDSNNWNAQSPEVALDAAVEGFAGISIELTERGDSKIPQQSDRYGMMGHNGAPQEPDYEVGFNPVEADSFFYDPRSFRSDFSDARYMGEAKWLDVEAAQELFPDHAEELAATSSEKSFELSTNPDRDSKWFTMQGGKQLVRLVDCWYLHKGKWCWTIFTGSFILDSGESYLYDEKGKTICRYIMFSCTVDHDGDRYGFVRNMRSAQDEYNARRSRALFTANSRRLIMTQGSVSDIERVRAEWARPDGVVLTNARTPDEGVKADDATFDFTGQLKLMENAIAELDNYGPNQALVGDMQNQSGRAIQLLQQAGMAELGPYILGYKGWKIRVYRALFSAIQRYWTGQRWIRVTDNQGVAQFVQINGTQIDPRTGMPQMVNAIGELDVDIIMDEGQDTINAQQDVYETLTQIMPSIAPMLKPQEAAAAVSILVESSSLSATAKKTWRDATQQQPDPMAQQAKQIALQGEAAKVDETKSKTMLNMSKAQSEGMPDQMQPGEPPKFELPPEIQVAQAAADIDKTQADATHKRASAYKAQTDAELAPKWAVHDAMMEKAQFVQDAHEAHQDRELNERKNRMLAHNRRGGDA
jgi:hypothetical protein